MFLRYLSSLCTYLRGAKFQVSHDPPACLLAHYHVSALVGYDRDVSHLTLCLLSRTLHHALAPTATLDSRFRPPAPTPILQLSSHQCLYLSLCILLSEEVLCVPHRALDLSTVMPEVVRLSLRVL